MILLHGRRFRAATYHQRTAPEDAAVDLYQGLVFDVGIEFEDWLDGRLLQAEAFLDPGADCSMISRRWVREQSRAAAEPLLAPWADPDGLLLEQTHITIEGWRVPLGAPERPVWIFEQDYGPGDDGPLPGYEDLLLGRDFLSQHDLLVVIDGQKRDFSVLAPVDPDNRQRRDKILAALM